MSFHNCHAQAILKIIPFANWADGENDPTQTLQSINLDAALISRMNSINS